MLGGALWEEAWGERPCFACDGLQLGTIGLAPHHLRYGASGWDGQLQGLGTGAAKGCLYNMLHRVARRC